jgi:Cytochrome P450
LRTLAYSSGHGHHLRVSPEFGSFEPPTRSGSSMSRPGSHAQFMAPTRQPGWVRPVSWKLDAMQSAPPPRPALPDLDLLRSRRKQEPVWFEVIAELLGVPARDRHQFKAWADALLDQDMDSNDKASVEHTRAQVGQFHEYLAEHVARRHRRPGDDLLSRLVCAEVDGARLEDSEIIGFGSLLLLAGHITTKLLLGNVLLCLDEHPEAQSRVRATPALIPCAIEEALRYRSPVPFTLPVTTRDVRIADVQIGCGEKVLVSLASANHDERRFPDPNAFVEDRHSNRTSPLAAAFISVWARRWPAWRRALFWRSFCGATR